jgi:Uma2 family endonuclease
MASRAATILIHDESLGEELRIPPEAQSFGGFRSWAHGEEFPERGRIDYLAGEIEVDMSPENLYTHSVVKSAVAAELHGLITKRTLGNVFIDRTRFSSPAVELSVEPDIAAVLWSSLDAARLRELPSARGTEGDYIEFEGPPDLVVEIVSASSVGKDTKRLPPLYAAMGVPEFWLIDARGDDLLFAVHELVSGAYRRIAQDDGWALSRFLGRRVRLVRTRTRLSRWAYELEHEAA